MMFLTTARNRDGYHITFMQGDRDSGLKIDAECEQVSDCDYTLRPRSEQTRETPYSNTMIMQAEG